MVAGASGSLLNVDKEGLVFGNEAHRIAHIRGQIVDVVAGGKGTRPREVVRHADHVRELAVDLHGLHADRDHCPNLDRTAVVPHTDRIAVLDAFFLSEFFGKFNKVAADELIEPGNRSGLRTGLPLLGNRVGRADIGVVLRRAAAVVLVLREKCTGSLNAVVEQILRR